MSDGDRSWGSLPADALAVVINDAQLGAGDVANLRLVCGHWRRTTNSHLKHLAPSCTCLEQVASIATRFAFLTSCDLSRTDARLLGHACLCAEATASLRHLQAALARMPSLASLHLSDTFSERMGQKHWAALVCAQAAVDGVPLSAQPAAASQRPREPQPQPAEAQRGGADDATPRTSEPDTADADAPAAPDAAPGPSADGCAWMATRAELADPGIKAFARASSRPGATQQRALWLPDWCDRLASLHELHVRGRQRPPTGLPPCLLWLHAGRTAPQLTSLSLVRLSLGTLPEQLQFLTGLTRLVAQDCALSVVPRGLARLSRLAHLDLSANSLTCLPPDLTALTALRHLDLQRNKLAALPADIGALCGVTALLLNHNQLRCLPTSLAAMRSLQHACVSYNWLGGMGASLPLLCNLVRLRRLELACVSDVRFRLVPPQELRLLTELTHLDLAANNLTPSDILGTLTSLRSLSLADCGLLAVPPWIRRLAPNLTRLDLSNNSLSELPAWLSACKSLRHMSIAHNRLSIRVPPAVLEQMPQLVVVESS